MTAAVKERAGGQIVGPLLSTESPTIASDTRIWRGTMVGKNAAGAAIPAGPAAVVVLGRAFRTVDNRTVGGDPNARKEVDSEYGTFQWENGGDITASEIGRACYALDDQTVTLSSQGDADGEDLPFAGIIHDVVTSGDREGVWVRMYGEGVAAIRELVFNVTDSDSEWTASTSQVRAMGTLPAGAFILGYSVELAEAFTGTGPLSALTVDVGTAGDADSIIDGADLFTAAVDGKASDAPAGIHSQGRYGGGTLNATFAATGGNLNALTAGDATIRVVYVVL